MLVLVINNGSTSSRFSLLDMNTSKVLASGGAENLFTRKSYYKYSNYMNKNIRMDYNFKTYEEVLEFNIKYITSGDYAVIETVNQIDAIGHRIVHGGGIYDKSIKIDESVINNIINISKMAPLHNINSVKMILACQKIVPNIPNIAVFDTTFHMNIPKENYLYPIPKELYNDCNIRKFGFHGISCGYALNRYSELSGMKIEFINSVICHMGGGCSITAIKNGRSYDTTMGYSPLSGMIMANRSGNIDPSIIPVMMSYYHISAEEALKILNTESGYYAICGNSDSKSIVTDSINGDKSAMQCRIMAANDFRKNLLSMMANLPSIDSIVLTGGMLSRNYNQRELFFENLEKFGIILDKEKNRLIYNVEGIISSDESKMPIYVIPSNEELQIATECKHVLKKGE